MTCVTTSPLLLETDCCARRMVDRRFGLERMVGEYERLYEGLLGATTESGPARRDRLAVSGRWPRPDPSTARARPDDGCR